MSVNNTTVSGVTRFASVILSHVLTEKSNLSSTKLNKYVFKVARNATKAEIKSAVEFFFNVEVLSVNTLLMPAVTRNFKGKKGYISAWKKAYVEVRGSIAISIGSSS